MFGPQSQWLQLIANPMQLPYSSHADPMQIPCRSHSAIQVPILFTDSLNGLISWAHFGSAATVLAFGPAAPLLYFVGGAIFLFSVALQKLMLVKLYARPVPLDEKIAERARVILQMLFGVRCLIRPPALPCRYRHRWSPELLIV